MLNSFVKIWVRLALKLFCNHIAINDQKALKLQGPLLLACNHPNSFLDAIIIGSRFTQPVHFLARGDAFKKPFVKKILTALKLIPIYRLSEGREYLALNDATFERCREVLSAGGILLIFSEGLCVNDYNLRPLKKGTARIASNAWTIPDFDEKFSVLPVGITYNSFDRIGKQVMVNFGEAIYFDEIIQGATEGETVQHFNKLLYQRIAAQMLTPLQQNPEPVQCVMSNQTLIQTENKPLLETLRIALLSATPLNNYDRLQPPYQLDVRPGYLLIRLLFILLSLPLALASYVANGLLYFPLKHFAKKKTANSVFYDSLLFALLLLLYPVYYCVLLVGAFIFSHNAILIAIIVLLPFIGWIHLRWANSVQVLYNYSRLSAEEKSKLKELFV